MKNLLTVWKFSISASAEVISNIFPKLAKTTFGIEYTPTTPEGHKCLLGYAHERADVAQILNGQGVVTGKKVYVMTAVKDGNIPGLVDALNAQGLKFRLDQVSALQTGYGITAVGFAIEFYNDDEFELAEPILNEWAMPALAGAAN